MARSIPADRFSAIVAASARVFIAHGYQRTQVQDVADALALAKGTLYGYAQGKAALFAAAVRYGDAQEALPLASELPVAAPVAGEIAAVVSARLAGEVTDMRLTHALRATLPPGATTGDARAELAGIVTDLYSRLARHRIALKLVDRCAPRATRPRRGLVRHRPERPSRCGPGIPSAPRARRPSDPARAGTDGGPDHRRVVRVVGGASSLRPVTGALVDRATWRDR